MAQLDALMSLVGALGVHWWAASEVVCQRALLLLRT